MPPYRTEPRRSRRLSKQSPRIYDGFEDYDVKLFNSRDSAEYTASSDAPHPPSDASSYDGPTSHSPPSTKARKNDEGHIPRPPNSFMLYRSHVWASQKDNPTETDLRLISCAAADKWNKLSEEEKRPWKELASIRKEEHAKAYPDYKYSPGTRKSATEKKAKSSQKSKVVRNKSLAKHTMPCLDAKVLVTSSPEQTPTPPEPSPSSSVQVSPQISLGQLPLHKPFIPVPASQAQFADEQAFGGPSLLSRPSEAEEHFEHRLSLLKIDEEVPAPAVVPPVMKPVVAHAILETEAQSPSPRAGDPTLPADRQIDSYFGYRPQIYNLDPQQTIFITSGGYTEVSSFANYGNYDAPMLPIITSHDYFNFGYGEVTHPYQPSAPSISEGNPFNEESLRELAASNPSYRFDQVGFSTFAS